jgi:hypothetical protein
MKCVGELLVIDLKGYNDGVNGVSRGVLGSDPERRRLESTA